MTAYTCWDTSLDSNTHPTITDDVTLFLLYTHTSRYVSATLTLIGPFVWLQHQVLFGLLQFFLQTLVLGSDLTDSLLAVLQQAKLGTDVHHLLTSRERTDRQENMDFTHLYLSRGVCCETRASLSAAACLTFTQLQTFTPHRLPVWPQPSTFGHRAASPEQSEVEWLLKFSHRENLYFMLFSPSFTKLTMVPLVNTLSFKSGNPKKSALCPHMQQFHEFHSTSLFSVCCEVLGI